jgi:hypothetical protein
MTSGMACYLTFSDADAETRFKKWVVRGNERSEAMGYSSLGLSARVLKVEDHKFLFLWDHMFLLSLSWFLRFMIWMQLRKVRKSVKIESVRKLDLVELVISRGLGGG